MTIIPKDGGNQFSGTVRSIHTAPSWQAANVTDELRARGLSSTPAVKQHYDTGFAVGGPIQRDRLWFFGSARWQVSQQYQQGNYYNRLQGTLFYDADRERPAYSDDYFKMYGVRLTWQPAPSIAWSPRSTRSATSSCSACSRRSGGPLAAPEAVGAHVYGPTRCL